MLKGFRKPHESFLWNKTKLPKGMVEMSLLRSFCSMPPNYKEHVEGVKKKVEKLEHMEEEMLLETKSQGMFLTVLQQD